MFKCNAFQKFRWRIPTGFRPPAQGCPATAGSYPGICNLETTTPKGLRPDATSANRCNPRRLYVHTHTMTNHFSLRTSHTGILL
jgi:hypothetical protein